jgi:hypothetical protein
MSTVGMSIAHSGRMNTATPENQGQSTSGEKPTDQCDDAELESIPEESEFEPTIRKLELPVRPRGVLAE